MAKAEKQQMDIVEKLMSYSAASGYARHMFAAAEEIKRLRAENEVLGEARTVRRTHYLNQDDCIALK